MKLKQTYRIPENVHLETQQHKQEIGRYLSGELSEEVFRSRRVPRGIYEQRQKGLYMLRTRIPGGFLWAAQAHRLADLSQRYAGGNIHFTTRQDAQFHDVEIAATHKIMESLLEVGLTPLGGGGNTVRNITTCAHAGIFPGETFDTLPYVLALTDYLLPLKSSYNLPRKFKIAFSCCRADEAMAAVNDLGFVAQIKGGEKGFAVYLGGGMGTNSRVSDLVTPFLPAKDVLRMAEAVIRVYVRHGDRRNRQRARLRFAIERIGVEEFHSELEQELQKVFAEGIPDTLPVDLEKSETGPLQHSGEARGSSASGYDAWMQNYVQQQKQAGLFYAHIPLYRGDLPADDLHRLAELAEQYAGSQLRVDRRQNLLLPDIPSGHLPSVYGELRKLAVDACGPEGEPWMVSCKGAATCSLGVCRSQDLNTAISKAVALAGIPAQLVRELGIHTSGCPNNCGQHAMAKLGFIGGARRAENRSYPIYNVVVGGGYDGEGRFRLSRDVARIPARNIPPFTVELLKDYLSSEAYGEGFQSYWQSGGEKTVLRLAASFSEVPAYSELPDFYRDWGDDEPFSLAGRSQGECGAGVFELIAEELKKSEAFFARAAEVPSGSNENLLRATATAAGSLLVTRGIEPGNPDMALKEFERHFIDTALAGEEHRDLLVLARAELCRPHGELATRATAVRGFLDEVQSLYDQMDASLNFPVKSERPSGPSENGRAAQELNLTGVACPMNFVHAKIALEQLKIGDILDVILDKGEPVENVPASFREQGQEVLEVKPDGNDNFRVRIRRLK